MAAPSLGVIGLGSMGLGMARSALTAGLDVKGFDVVPAACGALTQSGGTAVKSAAEAAADVDVILVMVVTAAQAEDALFGEGGAAGAARPGAAVMLCSTIAADDVRRLAARLTDAGLEPLDAPVSGGRTGAEAGSLTVMASGRPEAFTKARPVLDAVAGNVYEVGVEPGLGATYKIVHQLAAGVHLAAAAEVMALGANAGCDTKMLFEILSKSAGRSWMMTDRAPHMLADDYTPRSSVDVFVKDLGLAVGMGYETKTPLPLAAAAHQLLLGASAMGFGALDDAAVVKVYESMTGAPVKPPKAHARAAARRTHR